jgi:hypothetical protein
MSQITLHRASRILEAIVKALKVSEPKVLVKVSVFSENLSGEIAARQSACFEAVEATRRLLEIRGSIRAAVALANASSGISALLALKHAHEDTVAMLEKMPGVAPEPRAETDEDMMYRRRPKKVAPPPILDVTATLAMAQATKARFAAADAAVSAELEVSAVDAEASKAFRRMAVEARREADRVTEELRSVNATTRIDLADADLDWLTTHEVV